MAGAAKRKVSITLDADLVDALLAEGGESLSAQVNATLRNELDRRRRHRALAEYLDRLTADEGRLDSAADEAEIARYMTLLGGLADGGSEQDQTRRAG
jgi:Post-segregation antitoxin CcdA